MSIIALNTFMAGLKEVSSTKPASGFSTSRGSESTFAKSWTEARTHSPPCQCEMRHLPWGYLSYKVGPAHGRSIEIISDARRFWFISRGRPGRSPKGECRDVLGRVAA